jgi:hypothetical protein
MLGGEYRWARIDSGLAGVRLVMTRCALALPHEREGGRYLYILQKPDGGA